MSSTTRTQFPTNHEEPAKGCLRDCPAGGDDGVHKLVPKPARGPDRARDLWGGFEERQPVARRFFAVPAVLGPEHVHRPGDGTIAEPLEAALFPPGGDDTAARQFIGFDDDLPPAGGDGGGDDTVVGQILKRMVAASAATPVGSIKARGPVPG
ncbi:hypothetical protein [Paenarthrobacter aromaticivorans]|uniref:Uncharacterized protein n=1 Tax=Paenarthrobacter aromaticivorans TaxID=2849150 RepID=A0ABS6I7T6_9MICC|nr:hypothetical protein [Paenarthrobacter sp. MMS21-TAE1-1]MBU8867785.1 hypothetical protein [Paenarthrobacter sp. MMS21-TAE1-1]